jgi:molecular chaperone GrpE
MNDKQKLENIEEDHSLVPEEQNDLVETTEEIENLKNQIHLLEDKLLRVTAESENARKRHEKMLQDTKDYAVTNFAKDLLSVMDNLSRALSHKPTGIDKEMETIILGVEMTKAELSAIFTRHGLQTIEPMPGDKFDYNFHHAVSQTETDKYSAGSVVNTMQIGYKIKDRLLRSAMVEVVKHN